MRPDPVRDWSSGRVSIAGELTACVRVGRFGRRLSFLLSNILNGVAGIALAVAPSYSSVLVLRVILGFGVKGGWMTSYVLREEDSVRSR